MGEYKFNDHPRLQYCMDLVEVTEGATRLFVPVQDASLQFPPGSSAIFYNRRMELNRDATILLLSSIQPSDYLDAMGATGVRGLRVAAECGIAVTINDRNAEAVALIRRNADLFHIPVEIFQEDANVLMSARRFDAVDLDPFGSPAPFADAASRSARRYLFMTATDTAPLCGAHRRAGMRRYFARPLNTHYHREVALRILLGFAVREAVKYDRGVDPLCCFAREHFIRLHLRIRPGVRAADRTLARIGYILQCPNCLYRTEAAGLVASTRICEYCGVALDPIGPLWLGAIQERAILEEMRSRIGQIPLRTAPILQKLIAVLEEEIPTSSHYDYHRVAKEMKVSPPPIETVLERLREGGYRASRAHYAGTAIKTDASLPDLMNAIRE